MSETIYIKTDQNALVKSAVVCLKDVAEITGSNTELVNKINVLRLSQAVRQGKPGRYPHSVLEIIDQILAEFPNTEIVHIGEEDFIITYEHPAPSPLISWCKTALTCIITFFGAAFSIMTFNNDVDIPRLFGQLYTQFTGQQSDGFTVLEAAYSVGVGMGILLFFNHFGRRKKTADPTPLEVQLRTYEDNINKALIEADERGGKGAQSKGAGNS